MADKATPTADFDSPPSEADIARGQRDNGKQAAALPVVPEVAREVTLTGVGGKSTFTSEQLRQLSFEELNAALGVTEASEGIGTDQFGPILDDKHQLIGKPFIIVHWEFHTGTMGGFVSMWVMTPEGQRYIVNDGSTGIYHQLAALTQKTGQDSMLACKHGLRVSAYQKEMPNGAVIDAETFYIDTKL